MKIYLILEYREAGCRVHSIYTSYDLAKHSEWHLIRHQIEHIRGHILDRDREYPTYHVIEKTLKTNLKGIIK